MKKNTFTKKDIGTCVVFADFDGVTYSAKITDVAPRRCVTVRYFAGSPVPRVTVVAIENWSRLTRFAPNSLFMVMPAGI
jgi:hypothetical protein